MKQIHAAWVLCALAAWSALGVAQAQYAIVTPVVITDTANLGVPVYIFSPGENAIVTPTTSGALTTTDVNSFNSSSLWVVTVQAGSGSNANYYITAASPSAAGCSSGSADWSGAQGTLVSTVCNPTSSTTVSWTFALAANSGYTDAYHILPQDDTIGCVVYIVPKNQLQIPTPPCSITSVTADWQFVTLSF